MQAFSTRRRRLVSPLAVAAIATLGLGCLGAAPAFAVDASPHIIDSTVIVQTLDEGAKVTALAVEYSGTLDFGETALSASAFSVSANLVGSTVATTSSGARTVVRAYVNDTPSISAKRSNVRGDWIILELSRYDANAPVLYYTTINNQYPLTNAYSVQQTAELHGGGENIPAGTETVLNDAVVHPVVDDFSAEHWTGVGSHFFYRQYEPATVRAGSNGSTLYPLILALHGAGESGTDNASQLLGNAMATSWATPEAQAEHPTFIIAPQRDPDANNWNDAAGEAALMAIVENAKATLPIDPDRVYITGLSMGSIGTWTILLNSSTTFAGAVTSSYGPGADPKLAGLVNFPIWNFQSLDDTTVPVAGSLTAAKTLDALGASVIERNWAGNLPEDQAVALQTEQWAAAKHAGAVHQFTYFNPQTTGTAPDADGPSIACAGHFSWVPTYNNPVTHDWLMSQVRSSAQSAPSSAVPVSARY